MPSVPGYRILEEIASGASGTVYRAVQQALAREVALKLLSPGLFSAEETRSRFLREAKLQATLSHLGLVKLYDAGFSEDRPYLAMEWLGGGSLRSLLDREAPLSLVTAIACGRQIAAGLAHAHVAGIVHRDLKPENVLLTESGQARIADFGLAKEHAADQTLQTATGVILGTPGYIAPEAIRGNPAGPAADVYAVGVMLYEAISGTFPFPRGSFAETLHAQVNARLPSLESLRADVPAELDRLVQSCLAADPKARPTSAELASRLEKLSGTDATAPRARVQPLRSGRQATARMQAAPRAAGPATMVRPEEPAASSPRFPIVRIVAAAAVVLVLGATIVKLESRSRRAPSPPLARPPAVAPVRVDLPEVARVTVGSHSVRVWFSRPCSASARLVCRAAGKGGGGEGRASSGSSSVLADELRPDTDYAGTLLSGSGTLVATLAFKTLKGSLDASPVTWLSRGVQTGDELDLSTDGTRVIATWREGEKGRRHLMARESLDGGETWTSPETVTGSYDLSRAFVIWSPAGTELFWQSYLPADRRIAGRFRPAGTSDWKPLEPMPGSAEAPALAPAADGGVDILRHDGVGFAGSYGHLAFGAAPRPRWTDAFSAPAALKFWRMVRAGSRLVVVVKSDEKGASRRLYKTSTADPARGRWSALEALSVPGDDVGRFDVVADGERVVVGYASGDRTLLR